MTFAHNATGKHTCLTVNVECVYSKHKSVTYKVSTVSAARLKLRFSITCLNIELNLTHLSRQKQLHRR